MIRSTDTAINGIIGDLSYFQLNLNRQSFNLNVCPYNYYTIIARITSGDGLGSPSLASVVRSPHYSSASFASLVLLFREFIE